MTMSNTILDVWRSMDLELKATILTLLCVLTITFVSLVWKQNSYGDQKELSTSIARELQTKVEAHQARGESERAQGMLEAIRAFVNEPY